MPLYFVREFDQLFALMRTNLENVHGEDCNVRKAMEAHLTDSHQGECLY